MKTLILEHTYTITTRQMVTEDQLDDLPPDPLKPLNSEWFSTEIIDEEEALIEQD